MLVVQQQLLLGILLLRSSSASSNINLPGAVVVRVVVVAVAILVTVCVETDIPLLMRSICVLHTVINSIVSIFLPRSSSSNSIVVDMLTLLRSSK